MNYEQRLIAGCKRGESWARKEVYEKYAPAMMSICVRYVADYEQAKDVVQDGFLKLFTRIHQYEGRGAFSGWVHRIFVNTALEYLSKNEMYRASVNLENWVPAAGDFDSNRLEQIAADDLLECITELPEKYRTVFNLYAIEGFTHAEIAGRLGIQESASKTIFFRARKQLQASVLRLLNR